MKQETAQEVVQAVGNATPVLPQVPNTQDQLIEVTLALLAIIALIYGVAWLIKRNKGLMASSGFPMKTIGVLPMGVKEKILLVEVGDKQLLLGMTPQNINTLAIFDEPIVDATFQRGNAFSNKLKDILTGIQNSKRKPDSNSTTDDKA